MNLEQLIKTAELQSFKQLLRKQNINEVDLKDLLMNEKYDKSCSIGELLIYSKEYKMLSNNYGQLMKIFNG